VAQAQGGEELAQSWANVNACTPTQLGARAQLAGDGTTKQLYVRFTAQWLSPAGWVPVEGAAVSPWQHAGSAEFTWGQAGWNYSLSLTPGQSYQLRAVAELQWRGPGGRTQTLITGTCTTGA
jgi:hypothetical protein